jgi:hypothetical protein
MIKLIPSEAKATAHHGVVKVGLLHVIKRILADSGIKPTKKRSAVILHQDLRDYLVYLQDEKNLKNLIVKPAKDLANVIIEVLKKVPSINGPDQASLQILYYLFISTNYDGYFEKLDFIRLIDVDTCVYCNRNYIYCLKKSERVKPQIDHFFHKAKYPFLGMSYYNLIPICQTCNGPDCKGQFDSFLAANKLVNPYEIDTSEFNFSYGLVSAGYGGMGGKAYSVALDAPAYQSNLDVFKLPGLYALHTDHVAELVAKATLNYAPAYRDYLTKEYKRLGMTDHEINRLIVGNYVAENELHKRPLSKLYFDIANELGLIEE